MKAPIPIYLAVEDELSEWVARRALATRPAGYAVGAVFSEGGFGEASGRLFLALERIEAEVAPS